MLCMWAARQTQDEVSPSKLDMLATARPQRDHAAGINDVFRHRPLVNAPELLHVGHHRGSPLFCGKERCVCEDVLGGAAGVDEKVCTLRSFQQRHRFGTKFEEDSDMFLDLVLCFWNFTQHDGRAFICDSLLKGGGEAVGLCRRLQNPDVHAGAKFSGTVPPNGLNSTMAAAALPASCWPLISPCRRSLLQSSSTPQLEPVGHRTFGVPAGTWRAGAAANCHRSAAAAVPRSGSDSDTPQPHV